MRALPASLSGRLALGAGVFTLVVVLFTLVLMDRVLERFVTGQIDQRLDNKIVALASQVVIAADGTLKIDGDADGPPFDKPHHMSFWWVGGPKNGIETRWLAPGAFTPPSAADLAALPGPPPPLPGPEPDAKRSHPRTLDMSGPGGAAMHVRVVQRRIGGVPVTILAAAPVAAIAGPMREALGTVAFAVLGLALALILAALVLVRLSLRPLRRLQDEVADVRAGRRATLPMAQPLEIAPLVAELNTLLVQNAESLERARRHVANLAHGLKTPLATLSLQVDRLAAAEDRTQMQPLVGAIERRVRHHLGRARAAALDGPVRAQTPLAPRLTDLRDMLQKVHADKQVATDFVCDPTMVVACEPQDCDEMLGNLIENAFKYTRRWVGCRVRAAAAMVEVAIEDDGPGLAPEETARALQAGQRLDEGVPGHGFGLPIARELAELYGGSLVLQPRAPEPGLRVTLTLPRAR